MKISRDNYEVFFIDYLDGKLSPEQIAELMLFLSANPDLEEELTDIKEQDLVLNFEQQKVSFKSELKRTKNDLMITSENFDELCVSKIEGDLAGAEAELFEKYLNQNSDKLEDYQLFEKIRLEPDHTIQFPVKASLKRRYVGRRPARSWIYSVSSAAAIILIFFLFFNVSDNVGYNFLRGEDNAANVKNIKSVSTSSFEPFTVIGTETPSILAKSTNASDKHAKDPENYQYVDPSKAGFLKDMVNQLRSMNTGSEDYYVASNFFNKQADTEAATENRIENNSISEANEELFTVSPKNIVLVSGEVNSNEFLSNVLDEMSERYDENNETPENKITFWDIAETGVKGYSQLTGKKIVFNKETNEKGKITSLAINSGKFEFSRKKN